MIPSAVVWKCKRVDHLVELRKEGHLRVSLESEPRNDHHMRIISQPTNQPVSQSVSHHNKEEYDYNKYHCSRAGRWVLGGW